jgi:type IV pilus assembly protein PilY1
MRRVKQISNSTALLPVALAAMVSVVFTAPALAVVPVDASPVTISDHPSRMIYDPTRLAPVNLLLLADDSGSMTWAHAPDDLGTIEKACWVGNSGLMVNFFDSCDLVNDSSCYSIGPCGYPYPNPYPNSGSGYYRLAGYDPTTQAAAIASKRQELAVTLLPPPLMAAGFNKMAYDPGVKYLPPVYEDKNGNKVGFPSMGAGYTIIDKNGVSITFPKTTSGGYTAVGWPATVTTSTADVINRPDGMPVTIDMANVTSTTKGFPAARTYSVDQIVSLQRRYMNGATLPAQMSTTSPSPMPMHYFRTKVKWCSSLQTGGGWFNGSAASASCQDDRTDTYKYPYYYAPSAAAFPSSAPAFELTVLDYGSNTCSSTPAGRTCAEELENYANWYAYYGNRAAATRTVTSWALAGIDPGRWLSVGVVKLSDFVNTDTNVVGSLPDMTELRKDALATGWNNRAKNRFQVYQTLLQSGVSLDNKGTPLKYALQQIRNKIDSSTAVICVSCQRSYLVALTDGGWNDSIKVMSADEDDKVSSPFPPRTGLTPVYEVSGMKKPSGDALSSGDQWPRPVYEGAATAPAGTDKNDTLADVSLYSWRNELRNILKQDEVDEAVYDLASWKHLNTLALTYAGEGTLPVTIPRKTVLAQITDPAGTTNWPASAPVRSTSPLVAGMWPRAVDDLWHATISGGYGQFSTGHDPKDFDLAIETNLNNIFNRGQVLSELGLPPSRDLDTDGKCQAADGSTQFCGYNSGFLPSWGGNVVKRTVYDTRSSVDWGGDAIWSAEEALAKKLTSVASKKEMPPQTLWTDGRYIFTATPPMNTDGFGWWGGAPIDFTYNDMSSNYSAATLSTILGTSVVSDQKEIVNYLRGDWTNEDSPAGGKYRKRENFLGDFAHSAPVVVDKPGSLYADAGYGAFKTSYASRKRMIYAAGNDGMLHAFEDTKGDELWAFVPPDLFRSEGDSGIVNLTTTADSAWTHRYYADATPRVLDVDFAAPSTSPDWRTMLVGGMGKGGTSYYALDVTEGDNSAPDRTKMFQWTFTDKNMGYTYGRALMVKTNHWNGKWVAILPSGLNNGDCTSGTTCASKAKPSGDPGGDGVGRIFFIDVQTGAKLCELSTGVGAADKPSGLAYIRAFVKNAGDQTTDAVYGGDQLGNFWRFDLSGTTGTGCGGWNAVLLAELTNVDGVSLPVNSEPRIEIAGGNRWVMVGTGRFYDDKDIFDWDKATDPTDYSTMVKQGMFAFKDGTAGGLGTLTGDKLSDLDNITGLTAPILNPANRGWVDFFANGYQITGNADSLDEEIAYFANRYVPGRNVTDYYSCEISPLQGLLYARMVNTGALVGGSSAPEDGGILSVNFAKYGGKTRIVYSTGWNPKKKDPTSAVKDLDPRFTGSGSVTPKRSSIRFINR